MNKHYPWEVRKKVHVDDMVISPHFDGKGWIKDIRNEGKPQQLVYHVLLSALYYGYAKTIKLSRDQFTRVYYDTVSDDGSIEVIEPK
jgi:hypothetical protein